MPDNRAAILNCARRRSARVTLDGGKGARPRGARYARGSVWAGGRHRSEAVEYRVEQHFDWQGGKWVPKKESAPIIGTISPAA
jgi:hypothetical protein